jgi:hypothetical protein
MSLIFYVKYIFNMRIYNYILFKEFLKESYLFMQNKGLYLTMLNIFREVFFVKILLEVIILLRIMIPKQDNTFKVTHFIIRGTTA